MKPDIRLGQRLAAAAITAAMMVATGVVIAGAQDASPSAAPSVSSAPSVSAMPSPFASAEAGGQLGAEIEILDFAFPADIQIQAGNTVQWNNADPVSHTVTAADGAFDSGRIEPTTSFEQVFSEPGVFAYSCLFHPAMTGTITVSAGDPGTEGSPAVSPSPEVGD